MALSGSFGGRTANSRIKPIITWSAVQSVDGNYSDITAKLTYSRTNRGYTTGGIWKGTLTIGDATFQDSRVLEISYDSNTLAIAATARVFHDDYGQARVTVSATGAISGTSLTETVISGQVSPEDIPRASSVAAPDGAIGSCTTVVVQRKSDRYTHTLAYHFGALSGYIDSAGNPAQQPVLMSQTVLSFRIPEEFYDQIPDKSQEVCTLTCTTYLDGTQIGTPQTGQFQAYADEKQCCPQMFFQMTDTDPLTTALTGDPGVLVRYLSTARCRLAARPQKGALILSQKINGVEGAELELSGPEHGLLTFSATDSRGYTTAETLVVPIVPYVPLTVNAQVYRPEPTANEGVLTLRGSCWKGNFGQMENSLRVTVQIEGGETLTLSPEVTEEHTYRMEVPLTGLDYTRSYRITLMVADAARGVRQLLTLHKGLPVFDWGQEDFRFYVPVEVAALTVGGVELADYIRNVVKEMSE